jgi:hypothetical protein
MKHYRVDYQASHCCMHLELDPTEELREVVCHIPQSYPTRGMRDLEYLNTSCSITD